ncbi:MAG: DUF502 domain-containing protein [Planctomycetota bacterium]
MAVKASLGLFFKRGLRALLPTVLTIGVILIVVNFFSDKIVEPVNRSIRGFLVDTAAGHVVLDAVYGIDVDDENYKHPSGLDAGKVDWDKVGDDLREAYWPFIGFFVALLLVFIAGFILATFVGKRILGRFENMMGKFPVVKVIYPYARQVVEFFMKEKAVTFNTVVAVEYPRRGIYSLGFVTGNGLKKITKTTGRDMVNIFVPSSPTPVTGYTIFVPVEDVIPLPITVDEAVRIAISGGVLIPEQQQNPEDTLAKYGDLEPPSITVEIDPEEMSKVLEGIDDADDQAGDDTSPDRTSS